MQKKHYFMGRYRSFILVVCSLVVYTAINIYCSFYCLGVTKFNAETDKMTSSITVVQLTDIHSRIFGNENNRLVSKIEKNDPDIIVISGDIINSNDCDNKITQMEKLLSRLVRIAPVYISLGNQEKEYMECTGVDLVKQFSKEGAIILDKEYRDVQVKGQQIRIGGIYGYCLPERYHSNEDEVKFLRQFEMTDNYKVLLSHLPYAWTEYGFTEDYNIDLVFTGHVHGGQVIIPFIGGLYDSEIGFFPGKLMGIVNENNTVVVLSSGLGSGKEKLPRFNNIPEIVVFKITPK